MTKKSSKRPQRAQRVPEPSAMKQPEDEGWGNQSLEPTSMRLAPTTTEADMAAYDLLPKRTRRAIGDCWYPLACDEMLRFEGMGYDGQKLVRDNEDAIYKGGVKDRMALPGQRTEAGARRCEFGTAKKRRVPAKSIITRT